MTTAEANADAHEYCELLADAGNEGAPLAEPAAAPELGPDNVLTLEFNDAGILPNWRRAGTM
mgnify:CR=1 FL=1